MALPKIIPALADLTQDIAGPLPLGLLHDWASGTQDLESADKLLDSFQVEGTVVSTDASGLSRLTEEKDLLEVLALISAPKEIVHALGSEIGGKPVGKWVADNTEMYYPHALEPGTILDAMSEAQFRIAAGVSVKIGMCIHSGVFYEVGGGLYGRDAETVETIAERHAGPGEILATRAVVERCKTDDAHWKSRQHLSSIHAPGVFAYDLERRMPELRGENPRYPHPYPDEFFQLLIRLKEPDLAGQLKQQIYATYLRERVIVFLSRERASLETNNLVALLDDFVTNALMDTVIQRTVSFQEHVAGLGGGVAILTFGTPREALDFAQAIRGQFRENGLPVKIGIDQGPVLFFSNPRGPSGIAGDPVNIASKISEDAGVVGMINLTRHVADQIADLALADTFEIRTSNVVLAGVTI